MAQQVKVPDVKPNDLSLIPRTHNVEGKPNFSELSPDHTSTGLETSDIPILQCQGQNPQPYTYTHTICTLSLSYTTLAPALWTHLLKAEKVIGE